MSFLISAGESGILNTGVASGPSQWDYAVSRFSYSDTDLILGWLNKNGALGYQILGMHPASATGILFIMGRQKDVSVELEALAEDGSMLASGWSALNSAKSELDVVQAKILASQEELTARIYKSELELHKEAERLEKIRQGMIAEDDLKMDPRGKELLQKMGTIRY